MTDQEPPPTPESPQAELLKGLPIRVESWIRTHLRWQTIIIGGIGGLLGIVLKGILEGEGFAVWNGSVKPWFSVKYPDWSVTNGLILLTSLGWILAVLAIASAFLFYGADRRRLGQLEQVGQENAKREKAILQLTEKVGALRNQIENIEAGLDEARLDSLVKELEHLYKDSMLLDIIFHTDSELFILLTEGEFGEKETEKFVASLLLRTCELFGNHHIRASVYTPDTNDPEILNSVKLLPGHPVS